MKLTIALITILTDNFGKMSKFYQDVIGFTTKLKMDQYCEFESPGVRFAICDRSVMAQATGADSYNRTASGHAFELAFHVDLPEEVDKEYRRLVQSGATGIKPPTDMPWGQRTGFFADPDDNIHEIFAAIETN
ncbi:MAG: VOC family protein [Candidatus Marinimicrobia bacterium]|nr:VOC family protein [Candidatus Neomarinimicrobiota bacterium]MCF7828602.1 VOC family protein [Candidatus Neomarinimicrobiota bacterium]MCF7880343.1 VOC family protein [Candidatus Neomarinimicrobiota bacterium]